MDNEGRAGWRKWMADQLFRYNVSREGRRLYHATWMYRLGEGTPRAAAPWRVRYWMWWFPRYLRLMRALRPRPTT